MASATDRSGATRRRLRERAAAVREEEVRRALDALRARTDGDLPPRRRAAVEALAHAVVEELLAGPEQALDGADDPTRERVAALFDVEGDGDGDGDGDDCGGEPAREAPATRGE